MVVFGSRVGKQRRALRTLPEFWRTLPSAVTCPRLGLGRYLSLLTNRTLAWSIPISREITVEQTAIPPAPKEHLAMIYPWILEDTTYSDVEDLSYEVAVLPVGATEPHGKHLPYGQDSFHATEVAQRSCRIANEAGARTICLPSIRYGVDTNQLAFPFAMNVHQSTLNAVVGDLADSLLCHGIRKLVIVNGHGGNEFKSFLREVFGEREMFISLIDWWTVGSDALADLFVHGDDHAGEMETSIALHMHPDLVRPDAAGDGSTRETDFRAINEGWVRVTRPWHLLTKDSAAGNPEHATPEKGQQYAELCIGRIAEYFEQLSATPYDADMPYSGQMT
jgi:creatinine amidohydrolase